LALEAVSNGKHPEQMETAGSFDLNQCTAAGLLRGAAQGYRI
jgi:hypothetical protein